MVKNAHDGLGPIIEDTVVAAGGHWSRVIAGGDILRIIDLEGCQAVDFLCYNAADPTERYNAADTMKIGGSIFIGAGTALYSGRGSKLFTIVADSCGFHDTIGGCCSSESNFVRYGKRGTPNCRDNFLRGLQDHGLGDKDIVANINFFMYVPVERDGRMAIADGRSKPGDHVDLRAEMAALAVLSNCPQVNNPANGYNPTPIRVMIARPR